MENTEYQRIEKARKMIDCPNFKDFADKLGVSPQVFYDIKKGKHGISKALAEKIHKLDDRISVAWLLTGAEAMEYNAQVGEFNTQVGDHSQVNTDAAILKAMEVAAKSQEHIDRLLAIIEKLT